MLQELPCIAGGIWGLCMMGIMPGMWGLWLAMGIIPFPPGIMSPFGICSHTLF